MKFSIVALLVAYPLLGLLSTHMELPSLRLAALLCLCLAILLPSLTRLRALSWGVFTLILSVSLYFYRLELDLFLVKIPPLVILALVASVFLQSLLPNRIPLVTAIGESARGPLSDGMVKYTKVVTWVWTLLLLLMFIETLVLSIFGPHWLWSFMTNAGNYLLVGGLFVGEFILRQRLFPTHDHPSFKDYISIVSKANIRQTN